MSNVNSIPLKTKGLLRYHCGYHGNIVTIATRCLVMPIFPAKLCVKYDFSTPNKLLRFHCSSHGNLVFGWCQLCQGSYMPIINSI